MILLLKIHKNILVKSFKKVFKNLTSYLVFQLVGSALCFILKTDRQVNNNMYCTCVYSTVRSMEITRFLNQQKVCPALLDCCIYLPLQLWTKPPPSSPSLSSAFSTTIFKPYHHYDQHHYNHQLLSSTSTTTINIINTSTTTNVNIIHYHRHQNPHYHHHHKH